MIVKRAEYAKVETPALYAQYKANCKKAKELFDLCDVQRAELAARGEIATAQAKLQKLKDDQAAAIAASEKEGK